MKISPRHSRIPVLFFICVLSCTLSGCKLWHKIFGTHHKGPADYHQYIKIGESHIPADTTEQIVVWRRPHSYPGYLNKWLDSIHDNCGDFNITVFCGSCDSSLMLLTGNGIRTFISGTGGGKGGGTTCTSNCGPQGSGDTLYWAVNFPVDVNDSTYNTDTAHKRIIPGSFADTAVTVAVFDTGLEPFELHSYLYQSTIPTCLDPMAKNGWNFPDRSSNVLDDYNFPTGHGAIVSTLIVEQANFYLKNRVKILPVKIHNSHGESDLFSVLCGFAYAKERGANIINASFGYYAIKSASGVPDPGAVLLKEYIQFYLTNNNILLIAAAGNEGKNHDADVKALYASAGLPVPTSDQLRNLDNVNFYPASLAAELPNVISVTTVDPPANAVSPRQNFSGSVVDLGVRADMIVAPDHFDFANPRVNAGFSEGSSFATPIVTGIICSHYTEIKQNLSMQPFTKNNIISFLLRQHPEIVQSTTMPVKIKTAIIKNNAFTR